MEGIKFNDKHTYLDYGLILTSKTIGTPEPDIQQVKVPGRNGLLDLTEHLGETTYSNRPVAFEFEVVKKQPDYYALFSRIQNDLHGKKMKIILDIDKEFYFIGRVKVNEWKSDKKIGKLVIEGDADPYKYKLNETTHSVIIGDKGKQIINIHNLKMPVTPIIHTTGEVKIYFENITFSLNGSGAFEDILFTEGENILTVEGAPGTEITFIYQEGRL